MYYKDKDGKPHLGPIPEPHLTNLLNTGGSEIDEEEFRAIQVAMNTPPPKTLDESKADKLAAINAEKNRVRDGGFLVGGVKFDSDISARTSYAELGLAFAADPTLSVQNYKTSEGNWVEMDVELYQSVMVAGRTHLQSVFDWYKTKEELIAACVTEEELAAISSEFAA